MKSGESALKFVILLGVRKRKRGQHFLQCHPRFVEMEGFEPSSKRGTNKLSTCLVIDLIFE